MDPYQVIFFIIGVLFSSFYVARAIGYCFMALLELYRDYHRRRRD